MTGTIFILFIVLSVKHLVVDFFIQPPWMYLNKGTLFHPGGLVHAGLHGLVSFIAVLITVLFAFGFSLGAMAVAILIPTIIFVCFVEFVVHYIVDYAKVNVTKRNGWTAVNSPYYWWAMGIDQFLHTLTYIWMIYFLCG